MSGLVVHAGGRFVGVEEVRAAKPPVGSDAMAYGELLDAVDAAFEEIGAPLDWDSAKFALADRTYRDGAEPMIGAKLFAVVDAPMLPELTARQGGGVALELLQREGLIGREDLKGIGDWNPTIGLRQSYDKTFGAQLALGSRVFVCDNSAFSGDLRISVRNQATILEGLPREIRGLVERAIRWIEGMAAEIAQMRVIHPSAMEIDHVLIEGMRKGVWSGSFVGKAIAELGSDRHMEQFPDVRESGKQSYWSFFNALTRTSKEADSVAGQFRRGSGLVNHVRQYGLKDARANMTARQRAIVGEMEAEFRALMLQGGEPTA